MTTITIKTDGTRYEVLYALRKVGGVKNELVTDSMEKIKAYLAASHRCGDEDIEVENSNPTPQPSPM